jgi:hypothetical protein
MTSDGSYEVWQAPEVVRWCQLLQDSYRHWTGRELLERTGSPEEQARALFMAPVVVVSHGTEPDPILNYGNRLAMELFEMDWAQLTRMPSRLTAEPVDQAERERMLALAAARGYLDDYKGVRISATGRRFLVENCLVWTVVDQASKPHGQAATFARWSNLKP